ASLALYLKKCGWRIEGREKQAIFKKGQWHDLYNIAILKEEFDAVEDSNHFIDLVCPVDTDVKLNLDVKKFI
ncbi:MAG: GNAT family protein, partial [Psychrobacter sp.]|nr:GNAT family protein [Psychrobacter sp.]